MDRKRLLKNPLVWIALAVGLFFLFSFAFDDHRGYTEASTSQAMEQVSAGNVAEAEIEDQEQYLLLDLNEPVEVDGDSTDQIVAQYPSRVSEEIYGDLLAQNVTLDTEVNQTTIFGQMLIYMIPLALLLLLLFWFMSSQQGGSKVFSFGKSKAKQLTKDMPTNTFGDVAGSDEAVEELHEIKDFLQNPARYNELGAKIPKGVLLYGPPGTGKTLLARAVAGEAAVPFYSISGSDFVEMFVGVGASRVRDMFEQAKQNAPCIIFVDEIDAMGRQRGAGVGGGHDEREQTLNQLLVEMDGFDSKGGVILIAATNRSDILDPALLRPGRFDRQIPVAPPDLRGRKAILEVHSRSKPLASGASLEGLAKRTVGMSGADLANVLNEAALLTARHHKTEIDEGALEESVDRVIGGPARKGRIISEKEKKITAYHEGGHALAAWAMPDIEPVYKLTILPRGRTGGHALLVPEDDKELMTRSEMLGRLVFAMGGRTAEELVFHEPTTGASSDIEQATKIAKAMVKEYGMSARLGAVKYGQEQGDPFLGRSAGREADYSLEVAHEIDEEVRKLIETAHTEAWEVLSEYRDVLDDLVDEVLRKETLQRPDLERVFSRVAKRPRITVFNDFGSRRPSDKPPVLTPAEVSAERGEAPNGQANGHTGGEATGGDGGAPRGREPVAYGEAPEAGGPQGAGSSAAGYSAAGSSAAGSSAAGSTGAAPVGGAPADGGASGDPAADDPAGGEPAGGEPAGQQPSSVPGPSNGTEGGSSPATGHRGSGNGHRSGQSNGVGDASRPGDRASSGEWNSSGERASLWSSGGGSGPPNYGAPPGWRPATTAHGRNKQAWNYQPNPRIGGQPAHDAEAHDVGAHDAEAHDADPGGDADGAPGDGGGKHRRGFHGHDGPSQQ